MIDYRCRDILADTALLFEAVQRLRRDKTGRFAYSPSTESFAPVSEAILDPASPGFQMGRLPVTGTSKQAAVSSAEVRSRRGLGTYLDALVAQRTVPAAEQQLVQTKRARLTDRVSLFKTLGGNWESEEARD